MENRGTRKRACLCMLRCNSNFGKTYWCDAAFRINMYNDFPDELIHVICVFAAVIVQSQNKMDYIFILRSFLQDENAHFGYGIDPKEIPQMVRAARESWFFHGHPGWDMLPMHSNNFETVLRTHKVTTLPIQMVSNSSLAKGKTTLDALEALAAPPLPKFNIPDNPLKINPSSDRLRIERSFSRPLNQRLESLTSTVCGLIEK